MYQQPPAQKRNAADHYEGCCAEAMVDVSETGALVILILNVFSFGFGTFIASCMDRRGCNINTWLLSIAQSALAVIVVGYVWSIVWAVNVMKVAKENYGHHGDYLPAPHQVEMSHNRGHH